MLEWKTLVPHCKGNKFKYSMKNELQAQYTKAIEIRMRNANKTIKMKFVDRSSEIETKSNERQKKHHLTHKYSFVLSVCPISISFTLYCESVSICI